MEDAIRTYRLTKYYGGRKAVDGLDLRVPRGSVYGLLGRNGAGKSTTLKMLAGLVHPDHGRAELLGEDVAALSTQRDGSFRVSARRPTSKPEAPARKKKNLAGASGLDAVPGRIGM